MLGMRIASYTTDVFLGYFLSHCYEIKVYTGHDNSMTPQANRSVMAVASISYKTLCLGEGDDSVVNRDGCSCRGLKPSSHHLQFRGPITL